MIGLLGMPRGEEWIVLFVVVLLLFGPTKLPGLVRQFARAKKTWDEEIAPGRKSASIEPANDGQAGKVVVGSPGPDTAAEQSSAPTGAPPTAPNAS
ncbi:MAG TPA: twin-arginine translocase TatA/TatE family subunit [Kribbella sp.]